MSRAPHSAKLPLPGPGQREADLGLRQEPEPKDPNEEQDLLSLMEEWRRPWRQNRRPRKDGGRRDRGSGRGWSDREARDDGYREDGLSTWPSRSREETRPTCATETRILRPRSRSRRRAKEGDEVPPTAGPPERSTGGEGNERSSGHDRLQPHPGQMNRQPLDRLLRRARDATGPAPSRRPRLIENQTCHCEKRS